MKEKEKKKDNVCYFVRQCVGGSNEPFASFNDGLLLKGFSPSTNRAQPKPEFKD